MFHCYIISLSKKILYSIGSNPSLVKQFPKNSRFPNLNPEVFYDKATFDSEKDRMIIENGRGKQPYSKIFKEIAMEVGEDWEHIDLFFVRTRNQKVCKDKVYNFKLKELTDFGQKQFDLSKSLIIATRPKVIIVANAFASEVMVKQFKVSEEVDNEKGYHSIKINHKNTPLFLTSMLTGQRALDKYSRKRLIWHIKQAIKNHG